MVACPLEIASKLEICAVIRFLCANKCPRSKIYRQLRDVYDHNKISRQAIEK